MNAAKFVLNAFSLNMLLTLTALIDCVEIGLEEARELAKGATSAVGHADTANVFTDVLGQPVPMNRATVSLAKGDVVLVGQLRGTRLPEGATKLPEGAQIVWVRVTVK